MIVDMSIDLNKFWTKNTLIAIDTETTGKYPFESRLCEVAAVKWIDGQVVDTYETLINPQLVMSDEVIAIHNISNKMVAKAPIESEIIKDFYDFISDGIVLAHHAPFDLGFLSLAFEKNNLTLPLNPALCSSLLARNLVSGVPNHRLKTLANKFGIIQESAHRAMDDTKVCLGVTLNILDQLGKLSLEEVFLEQGKKLLWKDYSIESLRGNSQWTALIEALENKKNIEITYEGGSRKGKPRVVFPIGLVRNPNGDFLVAQEKNVSVSKFLKRYFLKKISDSKSCP